MLSSFFRRDRPLALLPLPFLVLLLWPGAGITDRWPYARASGSAEHMVEGMPLYQPVRWLMGLSPWAALLMSVLLVTGVAFSLVRVANDTGLHERRNYLPAVLLALLLGLLPFGLLADPALLGMWPVVWALGRTWRAIGRQELGMALFDAGLLLGLASLCYLPYGFLIVVIWSTLSVTRPPGLREFILPALGLATMLFLAWGTIHLLQPGLWDPKGSLHFGNPPPLPAMHWMHRVVLTSVLAVLGIALIVSVTRVYVRSVMREQNIRASLLAFCFAMALLALFAWWLDGHVPPALLAVPGSLLLTFPLSVVKKQAWADAALWSLLLLACWARWAG